MFAISGGNQMKKYVIILTFLLIGCSEPGQQNEEELRPGEVDSMSIFIRKSEIVGYSGDRTFKIYKLAIEGGAIYEYHYRGISNEHITRGFRVVFVPNNGQQQGRRP